MYRKKFSKKKSRGKSRRRKSTRIKRYGASRGGIRL